MRYFLYGYYGYGNFGDDLLFESIIRCVRQKDPDAIFYVRSRDYVLAFINDDKIIFTCIERHLEKKGNKALKLLRYLRELAAWIKKSDTYLIGGGTLFIDKGSVNFSILLLYLSVLYARILGKKVNVIGVAVDTLTNPITLWMTREIFRIADFVSLRDTLSLPYVDHCLPEKVRLAADLVFTMSPLATALPGPGDIKRVGFCFIDYFHTYEVSQQLHEAYETAILRFIENNSGCYELYCLTLQRQIGLCDDWLVSMLRNKYPKIEIKHIQKLEEATAIIGALDIVVTTRFHLGILSVLLAKPTILIDHELKMAALASELSLPSLPIKDFISGSNIDLDQAITSFDSAKVASCCNDMKRRAMLNFEWMDQQRSV